MIRTNPTFSGVMEGVAVTVAQDLFELTAVTTAVRILRIEVNQDTIEASEVLPIRLRRGIGATAGSGGNSVTPVNLKSRTTAANATLKRNNTTAATAGSGSLTTVARRSFNLVTGWLYAPTEKEVIELAPGQILVVNLPSAPAGSTTFSCEIVWEEVA